MKPTASSLVELYDLEVLLTVAERRSFRRASGALGVEPSAVSRRIRALEERLGVSMFERRATGVILTAAGQRFVHDVRGVISQIDYATRSVQEAGVGINGALSIGFAGGLVSERFAELLISFRTHHSSVQLELVEGTSMSLFEQVQNRVLDAALIVNARSDDSLDILPAWHEDLVIGLSSEDVRTGSRELPLAAFVDDVFIVSNCVQGRDCELFLISELTRMGGRPKIVHHRVSHEAVMLMVGLGFGVALTRESGLKLQYQSVSFIRLTNYSARIDIVSSPANDNPALRRLLSLARR